MPRAGAGGEHVGRGPPARSPAGAAAGPATASRADRWPRRRRRGGRRWRRAEVVHQVAARRPRRRCRPAGPRSAHHIATAWPSRWARCSAEPVNMPRGGRYQRGGVPGDGARSPRRPARSRCGSARPMSSAALWWLQVWLPSSWPSATRRRTSARSLLDLHADHEERRPAPPAAAEHVQHPRREGGFGPSSKVRATAGSSVSTDHSTCWIPGDAGRRRRPRGEGLRRLARERGRDVAGDCSTRHQPARAHDAEEAPPLDRPFTCGRDPTGPDPRRSASFSPSAAIAASSDVSARRVRTGSATQRWVRCRGGVASSRGRAGGRRAVRSSFSSRTRSSRACGSPATSAARRSGSAAARWASSSQRPRSRPVTERSAVLARRPGRRRRSRASPRPRAWSGGRRHALLQLRPGPGPGRRPGGRGHPRSWRCCRSR